jgi:hypothetical protein
MLQVGMTCNPGEEVELSALAAAIPEATYQWFKDGKKMEGETDRKLEFEAMSPKGVETGKTAFYVEVTHQFCCSAVTSLRSPSTQATSTAGVTKSKEVFVKVNRMPFADPDREPSVSCCKVNLSVEVSGTPTPAIQWYRVCKDVNGVYEVQINGATESTLVRVWRIVFSYQIQLAYV